MIWAIVEKSGKFTIHHDDPKQFNSKVGASKVIWPIDRSPDVANGEQIDFDSGEIIFDRTQVADHIVAEIKAKAGKKIVDAVPLWQQNNDLRELLRQLKESLPPVLAIEKRVLAIDKVRQWSDDLETQLSNASNADDISKIRAKLAT